MSFQLSIALWGLAALALPIIIHLLSKRRRSLIPFGSLAFLEKTESPSSKSIQFSQWWLLVLRLAGIIALVIAIAEPLINTNKSSDIFYVEDSILSDPTYTSLVDSLSQDHEIQCFSIGNLGADVSCTQYPNLWSFFYQVNNDARNTRIFTHNFSRYYRGTPVMPGQHITIHEVPASHKLSMIDTLCVGDSLYQIEYSTEAFLTKTALQRIRGYTSKDKCAPVRIGISRDSSDTQLTLLKTILQRINETIPIELELTSLDEDSDWKIIEHNRTESLQMGSNHIIWNRQKGPFSFTPMSPTLAKMQGTLDRDAILESHFPLHLTEFLLDRFASENNDNAAFDLDQLKTNKESMLSNATTLPYSIASFWFILALTFMIAERLLSTKIKRQ